MRVLQYVDTNNLSTFILKIDVDINIASTCKSPISDKVVLSLASIKGHKKSLVGSLIQLLYAVLYHEPLLTLPISPSSGTYLAN